MFRYQPVGIGVLHQNRFTGVVCSVYVECWLEWAHLSASPEVLPPGAAFIQKSIDDGEDPALMKGFAAQERQRMIEHGTTAELDKAQKAMKKGIPKTRHLDREEALYVQPKSETEWNRPVVVTSRPPRTIFSPTLSMITHCNISKSPSRL